MQTVLSTVIGFVPFAAALLDKVEPDSLARYGLLGVVLWWFMLKADKRLAGIEHKMEGLNRTMLIEILSRSGTSLAARQMAVKELRKIDPALADENAHFAGE